LGDGVSINMFNAIGSRRFDGMMLPGKGCPVFGSMIAAGCRTGSFRMPCLSFAVGTVVVLVHGTTLRKPSYPTKKKVWSRMMRPPAVAPKRFDRVLGRTSANGFLASSAEFRRYS